jgi:hypothetical protein
MVIIEVVVILVVLQVLVIVILVVVVVVMVMGPWNKAGLTSLADTAGLLDIVVLCAGVAATSPGLAAVWLVAPPPCVAGRPLVGSLLIPGLLHAQ